MNKKILIVSLFATLMLLVPMTSVVGVISKNVTMDNQPPNPPSMIGRTRGKVGVSYEFTFVTTDPDGDNVSYYIDWDDGNITNWTAFQPSGYPGYSEAHTWTKKGIYLIGCKANDTHGAESDWAYYRFIVETKTVTHVTADNQPPNAPSIHGPQVGRLGTHKWTFNATDPDGDNVSYIIHWDDGNTEGWTAWYASGEEITRSHTYNFYGDFVLRAKAKDIHGLVGPEGSLNVIMPRNKNRIINFNSLFLRLFEQFPNLFPILRHLLRL